MELLIGHTIGDFLLQPKSMALAKSRRSDVCALHCAIYSLMVWAFVGGPWWFPLAVGVPHFIIDRWSLAAIWMKLTQNRDFREAYSKRDGIVEFYDAPFTAIVYVVIDQTFHAICLWVVVSL